MEPSARRPAGVVTWWGGGHPRSPGTLTPARPFPSQGHAHGVCIKNKTSCVVTSSAWSSGCIDLQPTDHRTAQTPRPHWGKKKTQLSNMVQRVVNGGLRLLVGCGMASSMPSMFAVFRELSCAPVAASALAARCRAFLKYPDLSTWIATLIVRRSDSDPHQVTSGRVRG
jgi:hypothetical protein